MICPFASMATPQLNWGRFTGTDRNSGSVAHQGRFVDTLLQLDGRWQVLANSYVVTTQSTTPTKTPQTRPSTEHSPNLSYVYPAHESRVCGWPVSDCLPCLPRSREGLMFGELSSISKVTLLALA